MVDIDRIYLDQEIRVLSYHHSIQLKMFRGGGGGGGQSGGDDRGEIERYRERGRKIQKEYCMIKVERSISSHALSILTYSLSSLSLSLILFLSLSFSLSLSPEALSL